MPLIRAGVERLLFLVLAVARGVFILQGVAFACASAAVFTMAPPDAPAWLRDALVSCVLVSGAFFLAGLLLPAARRWRVAHTGGGEPVWPWRLLLGLSLLALPAVAAIAASDLPPLWSRIAAHLAAIGFWDTAMQPGPSGLVMIPILLALFVPVLVTAAALLSVAFPLALVPLLAARSRLFPTLLVMGVICQAVLVLNGWIAADAFVRLVSQAHAAMTASGDAEVLRVAGDLDRETRILTRTAVALVAPLLGMLAWLVFLRPSGAAAASFTAGASSAQGEAIHEAYSHRSA